jgi:hypothetical protein
MENRKHIGWFIILDENQYTEIETYKYQDSITKEVAFPSFKYNPHTGNIVERVVIKEKIELSAYNTRELFENQNKSFLLDIDEDKIFTLIYDREDNDHPPVEVFYESINYEMASKFLSDEFKEKSIVYYKPFTDFLDSKNIKYKMEFYII